MFVCFFIGIVYRKRLRSDVDSGALSDGEGEPTAKRPKRTEDPTKEEGSEVCCDD